MPSLVPVTANSRTIIPLNGPTSDVPQIGFASYQSIGSNYGLYGSYNQPQTIGSNHRGINERSRIIMALKSGIPSEVDWALMSLARNSIQPYLQFEEETFIAHELIKYLFRPFQLIHDKKYELVDQSMITHSLDALLTLRNSVQDLSNQQWLSQIPSFKKQVIDILKILSGWFFQAGKQIKELVNFEDQFSEALTYIIDLLEPLTCYYINNTKNDVLFNTLFPILLATADKNLFINTLKCISHLLITWHKNAKGSDEEDDGVDNEDQTLDPNDDDDTKVTNNCVDAITDQQLEHIVNTLLVGDNDLNNTVLDFLKMYLFSEALHNDYPNSVKDSQILRLKNLLQLSTTKANYETLIKQLPLLLVSNLALTEPMEPQPVPNTFLTRRTQHSNAPIAAPELTKDLYRIMLQFPEPARATTWLHCCYEPTTGEEVEVTQISIWKSYETQFQEIWKLDGRDRNPNLHPLLPAVDFIKNVTKAFPNAEAKVLSVHTEGEEQPKKKFIIQGIQPRQFPVNIETGNYEALKSYAEISQHEGSTSVPIGHFDSRGFENFVTSQMEVYLSEDNKVSQSQLSSINESSRDILEYVIQEVLEKEHDHDHVASNLFRLHNSYWLPDLVYANPSLVETGIVNGKWLKYLL
ncbi:RSC9 [Candida margitis]|uniref:RSC9 n=1 Tax=Candida margitis TaxID=1775924 RepID=UPI0022260A26|nr:RSC9 [Candida margitis]KAI5969128.1 RSC9 [Candida margitis]